MKKVHCLFLAIIICWTACESSEFVGEGTPLQPQTLTKINLPCYDTSTNTDWKVCSTTVAFDYNQFVDADSIIFLGNLRSQREDYKCIAELYNFTDDQPISNSRIQSRINYTPHPVRSNNLLQFPNYEIQIGIRFKSSHNNHYVEVNDGSAILIYR